MTTWVTFIWELRCEGNTDTRARDAQVPKHTKKPTTKDHRLDKVPWMWEGAERSLHFAY